MGGGPVSKIGAPVLKCKVFAVSSNNKKNVKMKMLLSIKMCILSIDLHLRKLIGSYNK